LFTARTGLVFIDFFSQLFLSMHDMGIFSRSRFMIYGASVCCLMLMTPTLSRTCCIIFLRLLFLSSRNCCDISNLVRNRTTEAVVLSPVHCYTLAEYFSMNDSASLKFRRRGRLKRFEFNSPVSFLGTLTHESEGPIYFSKTG
jgi:hypothetical protein